MNRLVDASVTTDLDARLRDFERLVVTEGASLRRLARRLLGDADEADDLLQDALVNAYKALQTFRGESSMKTWVWRIVTREGFKKLRRRKLKNKVAGWFRGSDAPPPGLGLGRAQLPDSLVGMQQQMLVLQKAMEKLPDRQRATLVMRYFEGIPVAEIAEVLEIGPGTVKTHLVRALKQVRAAWPKDMKWEGEP